MPYKQRSLYSEDDHYAPRVYSPIHSKRSTDSYTYTTSYSSRSRSAPTHSTYSSDSRVWLKYCIYGANVIFALVGTILLALGIWLRYDSRFRDFLSERYRQAVVEAFWEAPTLFIFSYIIIVLGACMIVSACLGCCGLAGSSRLFLTVYAIFIFILLVGTLSAGIYLFYKRDGIDVELSDALDFMVQHYYQGPGIIQESLDHLQTTFRCCGNSGCADFRTFRQDPPRSCDIRCDGCHYRISVALHIGFSITVAVFSVVVLCQIVAICIAVYLIFTHDNDYKCRVHYEGPRRAPRQELTREALQQHDLPYTLKKSSRSARRW